MRHETCLARKRFVCHFISLMVALLMASSAHGEPVLSQEQYDSMASGELKKAIHDAIRKVRPALVRILVVSPKYSNGREVKFEAAGSGAIITKEGHIITNHHVAGNAKQIVCTLSDKEEIDADLIGTDPLTDISIIKLRSDGKRSFPVAGFGDSSLLKVGDHVLSMGSPFALSQSVTMGIISNLEVVIPKFLQPVSRVIMDGEDVGSIVRWIGHDARIYGGNSGGPLVNLKAEIIGINEISLGISGAIPGNLAKKVADELIQFGKVRRSWFGLEIQPLLRHSGQERGSLVSGVVKGSPAEKGGFLPGDVLLNIDGKEVNIRFSEEVPIFNQMLMAFPVGQEVTAIVQRNNKEVVVRMTSQERENVMARNRELKQWGITARDLSMILSKTMKRNNQEGVLVTSVRPGGPCWEAKPSIVSDDVIVGINGAPVKNTEELLKLTGTTQRNAPGSQEMLVEFERKKEHYLTIVNLAEHKEIKDQGIEARKPWLSVGTQVLTREIAEGLGVTGLKGVRVTQVYPGGNAERVGVKVGDIIVRINGEIINGTSPEDKETLREMIQQYDIGSTVDLIVLRGKETSSVSVELEPSAKSPGEMKKYVDSNFEFTVRDVAFLERIQEDWKDDGGGVLVESVSEGGWASLAKLSVGDLILAVDDKSIVNAESFGEEMSDIATKKPRSVILQVLRDTRNLFIELESGWSEDDR